MLCSSWPFVFLLLMNIEIYNEDINILGTQYFVLLDAASGTR